MRRTYRSKKDTGGVVDRRDLLQNLDEKSSAYDAFFIQNIKQTKRELSCVGSSNAHGIASNRVRKKKYVKRIMKEVETPTRESLSRSAYLTPDKSIRVNKPMDPFDMLLNSSPACVVETQELKTESVTSKVDAFDKVVQKKEGRTYVRKKTAKPKKVNYSSSDNDSDKENSDEHTNITRNTSDIKAYKLLIENDNNKTPKRINDSINNIVNNLSLMNRLKLKNSFNDSVKRPYNNKHRLTRNMQSPIFLKSPLCSTPFKAKYRGESIYKFSPITNPKDDNSPKFTTITEDNDDMNNSIILLSNNKTKRSRNSPDNVPAFENASNESVKCDKENNELELAPEDNTGIEEEPKENSIEQVEDIELLSNDITIPSVEISSLQTTEAEPFLGFSNNDVKEIPYNETEEEIPHCDDTMPSIHEVEVSDNESSEENNVSCVINAKDDDNNSSQESNSDDKNSLYDSCISEQSSADENEILKEPIVKIKRMNDSSFLRFYEKLNNNSDKIDDDKDNSTLEEIDHNDTSNHDESVDSDNSNHGESVDNDNSNHGESIDNDNSNHVKSDDDSNYEESDANVISSNDAEMEENNDSLKDVELSQEEEFNSFATNDETNESNSDIKMDKDTSILENELIAERSDSDVCNDVESNDEEKCISFVTTRRRNEVTNNSMMSIFNDSYASSSTDCDKTVLSNNKVNDTQIEDENEDVIDEIADDKNELDLSKEVEPQEIETISEEKPDTRISFVTTRNSNITDRRSCRNSRQSTILPVRNSVTTRKSSKLPRESINVQSPEPSRKTCFEKPGIVLQPGKKWERSLSIYRRITMMTDHFDQSILEDEPIEKKGRKYRQSVICTMEMQELNGSLHNESINSRRSTFVSKPSRSTIRIVKDSDISRLSLCNTTVFNDLKGFLNEECDDTIIELSKLSIADQTHEVTVLDTFHDTSSRLATPRDYVLRRCGQADAIQFDECYPDTALKNCHKIGEGVYGEVFLWRARDGRARVLKIVPIAGTLKVNGESQKDFHEIISEIVIAMELSAIRAPIAEINRHFDEGKDVEALNLHAIENATDIFNEVLAVRCVYGSYPARLLDLWDLYDECKGSENDNPAILPTDQQFIVLELANAGQDLESYQFNSAEQAYALFLQVAYGLAVAEEAFQFEHRDLHWGNVLIAPTEQKYATFVIRGRAYRVARCGVAGTIIDYSLSRVSLPLAAGECAALYNDLATDDSLFDAVGDYQFEVYRLMRDKLGNDWKNFEPYTNILWLHYTVDKMITSLRYKRTNTKIHKHYIDKLKGIKNRILDYGSAALFVLTDNEI